MSPISAEKKLQRVPSIVGKIFKLLGLLGTGSSFKAIPFILLHVHSPVWTRVGNTWVVVLFSIFLMFFDFHVVCIRCVAAWGIFWTMRRDSWPSRWNTSSHNLSDGFDPMYVVSIYMCVYLNVFDKFDNTTVNQFLFSSKIWNPKFASNRKIEHVLCRSHTSSPRIFTLLLRIAKSGCGMCLRAAPTKSSEFHAVSMISQFKFKSVFLFPLLGWTRHGLATLAKPQAHVLPLVRQSSSFEGEKLSCCKV